MAGRPSFFAELQRRHVYKVGAAYAVGGWLLVQVITQVFPIFHIAESIQRGLVLLIIASFPVALVLAWLFDLTPEGIVRTSDVADESEAPALIAQRRSTERKLNVVLSALLLLALSYFVAERLGYVGNGSATAQSTGRSIAVLPFVNLSDDPQNDYFSDGVAEEILNVLARIPDLKVAARTSSFSFKGEKKGVPEIAKALHVGRILEGGVRRLGDRVRVTAQLIDAESGFEIWTETYDRDQKDIFAIQDDIAQAIASALKVKLSRTSAAAGSSTGTQDPEAYDHYLQGLTLWQRRGETAIRQAIAEFEKSSRIDPQFAQAYSGLALAYFVLPDYSAQIRYDEAWIFARDNAERALALDPSAPEPYAVLGGLADESRRGDAAIALIQRAIALRPSFATAYQWLSDPLLNAGRLDDSEAAIRRASELDPRSSVIAQNLAFTLVDRGRYVEAASACKAVLDESPNDDLCLKATGYALLMQEDYSAARPLYKRIAAQKNPRARREIMEIVDALAGHADRHAVALRLASYPAQSDVDVDSGTVFRANDIPSLLVRLGEPELALHNLESMTLPTPSGLSPMALTAVALGPLHCDPRFEALAKHVKLSDPHHSKLCEAKG